LRSMGKRLCSIFEAAGGIFKNDAKAYALESVFYVIEQSGDKSSRPKVSPPDLVMRGAPGEKRLSPQMHRQYPYADSD
jgi:hypothetical protein